MRVGAATLRAASIDDVDFMREMLVEAAYPPGTDRPPIEQALADPAVATYIDGWGRPGDLGVVAVDPDDPSHRLGAAWFRLFDATRPAYGFVDEATPELATAVRADARGQGLGRRLVLALLEMAAATGYRRVSLSVSRSNVVAGAVYRSCGFVPLAPVPVDPTASMTMVALTDPEMPRRQSGTGWGGGGPT